MAYHGDIALGQTIDFQFNTFRFSTGAPFTLAGTPTLAAYVGNSTTQITAGLTLTVDFDAKTGAHNVRCVASGANGYAAGTDVTIVLEAGTVDSVSVANAAVGSFSIENRRSNLTHILGTAVSTPATAGILDVNVKNIDNDAASAAGAVTFPGTLASTTNITAGTITTATNVTTVNGLAANTITAASIAADAITDAKVAADVTIASVTGAVGSVTGAVGSVTAGVTLAASAVQAIWDALTTALTTVGSVGKLLVDNVNATISSRSTYAGGAVASVTAEVEITQTSADKIFGASGAALPELAQGIPSATPSPRAAIMALYMALRNKLDVTATTKSVTNDAGTVIFKKALSDDGTTYSEAEAVSGP